PPGETTRGRMHQVVYQRRASGPRRFGRRSAQLYGYTVDGLSRHPHPPDLRPVQALRIHPQQILVEYDQIRPPTGLDPPERRPPARHPIGLLEMRLEGAPEPDPLLGVKRLGFRLTAQAAEQRRLKGEERSGAIVGSVGPEEKPRARAGERPPRVGAARAGAAFARGRLAVGGVMDGLNRCEHGKSLEPGNILFAC